MQEKKYNKKALDVLITRQIEIKGEEKIRALHLLITGKCNNRCVFCFSRKELLNINFKDKDLKGIIKDSYNSGAKILVLSGGEPTIHPNFLDLIAYAKTTGYSSIRTISNGRMFAYSKFAKKAKKLGLNEVTISIHSHIPIIQDELSGVEGSFNQALKGIENCKRENINLKINIVVNRKNIKKIKETILFFYEKMGVKRISLLRLMPFGLAWKNKSFLYYNKRDNKYLKEALECAKKNNIELWINRFDLNLFRDYPEFVQNPYKFVNEVESKIIEFEELVTKNKEMYCYPKRCPYCFLENFCKEIREVNKRITKGEIKKEDIVYLNETKKINPLLFSKEYIKKYYK